MELEVKSHALKKQLARDINTRFKGAFFTEFKKNTDIFVIKKYFKRNEGKSTNSYKSQSNPESLSVSS